MNLDKFLGLEPSPKRLPVIPHRYDPSNPFGKIGVQSPVTLVDGKNVRIHELILGILLFHHPPPATILDPTCGIENHMFSPWLRDRHLDKIGYRYMPGDIQPYGTIQLDVLGNLPFRDNSFDIIVYDPPYTPNPRNVCDRGKDYGIEVPRTHQEIKKYFSEKVFAEFHRVLRKNGTVVVKGEDYYYPRNTDNLFLFIENAEYRKYFRPIALYIYRFYHGNIPLIRYRMRNYPRPITLHTYFLVLRRKNSA